MHTVHPWRRVLARRLDYLLGYVIFISIYVLLTSHAPKAAWLATVPFVWCFVEAFLISQFGTTPGKALFGLSVISKDKLPFETDFEIAYSRALKRSVRVWAWGEGFGFPLFALITLPLAYARLKSHGETSWDRIGNYRVALHWEVQMQSTPISSPPGDSTRLPEKKFDLITDVIRPFACALGALLIGLVLLAVSYQTLFASDATWLCTEESSQRTNNVISACGIGVGKDENEARLNAFDNSKAEFQRICDPSDDCKGRTITVQPQRTSCEKTKVENYKCYRLITFVIGISRNSTDNSAKIEPLSQSTVIAEKADNFRPFIYSQTETLPKVRKGMTKRQLLAQFGLPKSVQDESIFQSAFNRPGTYLYMQFEGRMCEEDGLCSVTVRENKVFSYTGVKSIYTEDLR